LALLAFCLLPLYFWSSPTSHTHTEATPHIL
jgi:hypothetical protein